VGEFRRAMSERFEVVGLIAELANAYKHCVRSQQGITNARDLQRANVSVQIDVGHGISTAAEYEFVGPLPEHEKILEGAFQFWLEYNSTPAMLDNVLNV
jgi:hypothetical protein